MIQDLALNKNWARRKINNRGNHTFLEEKHAVWAQKQAADMIAAFTPKENATDKEKQNLKESLLYYYGYSDVSEIKPEHFTLDVYVENYGKENLYGGYQLDRVMNALYDLNYGSGNTGSATWKDVDLDFSALPTDVDSHEGHNHD